MATWSSRGLRGQAFEELINHTLETYRNNNLCLIQKIPTPITPIEFNKERGQISLAYFEKKSTVDYIGVVQSIPVCFDAKECNVDRFSLQNIHVHQIEFMKDFETQGGVAFFLIYFTHKNTFYYMRFSEAMGFVKRSEEQGIKSFKYEELSQDYFFLEDEVTVPFLDKLDLDLEDRDNNQ